MRKVNVSKKLELEILEDRLCMSGSAPTAVETYEWALINAMRANPTGFANQVEGLLNGTVNQAFGFKSSDPVVKDLNSTLKNAAAPDHYQQALSLLRSVTPEGPLAWDPNLQAAALGHDLWMRNHSYQHSGENGVLKDNQGNVIYVPGFTTKYTGGSPDNFVAPAGNYSSLGENIGFEDNALQNSWAAYPGGNPYLQRVAFYDAMTYILEPSSDSLGHLRSLLGHDSTNAGLDLLGQVKGTGIPNFNVIGFDLYTYGGPHGPASESTQRFSFFDGYGAGGGGFVSGVAYQDTNGNNFYDVGEGINVTITIDETFPDGLSVTTSEILAPGSNNFGAFNFWLPNGACTVTAYAGGRQIGLTWNTFVNNNNHWIPIVVSPGFGLTNSTTPVMSPDRYEPNNTTAAAFDLGNVTPTNPLPARTDVLSIDTATDLDWFRFSLDGQSAAGNHVFLGYDRAAGLVRGSLLQQRADGSFHLLRTDRVSTEGGTIDLSGLSSGTYYLGIDGVEDTLANGTTTSGVNFYSMTIDLTPAATDPKPQLIGPPSVSDSLRPELSWVPVANANSYRIWIDDLTSGTTDVLHGQTVSTTSYQLTSALIPGHSYRYWVQSNLATGAGPWSASRDFSAGLAIPMDETTFTTIWPTLSWSAVPGASQYQVWIDDVTTGQSNIIPGATVAAGNTWQMSWATTSALASGDTYRWWVKALNSAGQGSWSNAGTFNIAAAVPLNPSGSITNLRPTFSWTSVGGAVSYDLYVSDVTTGSANLFPGTRINSTSWTATSDLVSGHSYQLWVRALNSAGAGSWSAADSFSVAVPVTGAVVGLNSLRPTLNWTGVAGAGSYEVWVTDLATGQSTDDAGLNAASCTPKTDLVSGDNYRWWVRANSAAGAGAWSKSADFSVAVAAPAGPAGTVGSTRPTFYWNAVAGAQTYELWVDDVTSGQSNIFPGTKVGSTSWTAASSLVKGHTYRWWVRALNGAGQGEWSAAEEFAIN